MALILKGDVTIKDDGTELYIEFLNATGVYDVDDNPGGFGTPNPARNTLAIILVAEHKLVAADQAATILAYNPLSVTSFTITITKAVNGVLQWNLLAIPIFDSGGTYVDGDIVYDNENPAAPFIKKRVLGVWEEITAEEVVGEAVIVQANEYSFPIPDAIEVLRELSVEKLATLRDLVYGNDCKKEDYEPINNQFNYVDALISSATSAWCAQAYNEAQIDIEEVFNFETQVLESNG